MPVGVRLRNTYELYFRRGEADREFEALTCFESELMGEVRRILGERRVNEIEVHRLGQRLFTLAAGQ